MTFCRFTTDPADALGRNRRLPGYVVTLPDKEEYLANPNSNYYPPGW